MVKALIILALALPLAGCQTIFGGIPCSIGPFQPDKGASTRWTRDEQEQLRTLNNTGARLCGWRPS